MNCMRMGVRLGAVVALAVVLFWVMAGRPAAAQTSDPVLENVHLQLWSEYDDPGLLVIVSGDFAATTPFPRDVAFPMPSGARNIQATYRDTSAGLLIRDWRLVEGKLTYNLPVPAFHFEYYIDRPPSGNQREIKAEYEAPYAIKSLTISVQQPARATEFTLAPPAESTVAGDDGLTYHNLSRTDLAAGDKLEIVLRYTKTDSGLSRPQLAVTGAQQPTSAPQTAAPGAVAPAQPTGFGLGLILLIVGCVGLTAALGYWLRQNQRARSPARSVNHAPSPARTGERLRSTEMAEAIFCSQCGRSLRSEDRFCAQCGTPRRV